MGDVEGLSVMEFGLFSIILLLIGLASFIWLVIVAFRESVIWGFLVFLFSPISAAAFSIYHWEEAKKPFLIYLAATIIFIVMFFNAFNKIGGMETIEVTQKAADQLEKGEITEVEAAKRVAEQMESNIKRMEDAGLIGAKESKMLEEKIQELKLDESSSTVVDTPTESVQKNTKIPASEPEEAAVQGQPKTSDSEKTLQDVVKPQTAEIAPVTKAAEEKLEYGPDWSLEGAIEKKRQKNKMQQLDLPEPKVEGTYVPISVSRAEEYIGQLVRVVKEANRYEGLLKAVNENFLVLDMQVSGGQAHFEVKRHHVRSMSLLKIPPKK